MLFSLKSLLYLLLLLLILTAGVPPLDHRVEHEPVKCFCKVVRGSRAVESEKFIGARHKRFFFH